MASDNKKFGVVSPKKKETKSDADKLLAEQKKIAAAARKGNRISEKEILLLQNINETMSHTAELILEIGLDVTRPLLVKISNSLNKIQAQNKMMDMPDNPVLDKISDSLNKIQKQNSMVGMSDNPVLNNIYETLQKISENGGTLRPAAMPIEESPEPVEPPIQKSPEFKGVLESIQEAILSPIQSIKKLFAPPDDENKALGADREEKQNLFFEKLAATLEGIKEGLFAPVRAIKDSPALMALALGALFLFFQSKYFKQLFDWIINTATPAVREFVVNTVIPLGTEFMELLNSTGNGLEKVIVGLTFFFYGINTFFGAIGKAISFISKITTPTMKIVGSISKVFSFVGKSLKILLGVLKPLGFIFSQVFLPLRFLITAYEVVSGAIEGYRTEGLFGAIKGAIKGFLKIITLPVDLLKDVVSFIARKLGYENIADILDSFSVTGFVGSAVDTIAGLFKSVLEWFAETFTAGVKKIQSIGAFIADPIGAIFGGNEDEKPVETPATVVKTPPVMPQTPLTAPQMDSPMFFKATDKRINLAEQKFAKTGNALKKLLREKEVVRPSHALINNSPTTTNISNSSAATITSIGISPPDATFNFLTAQAL